MSAPVPDVDRSVPFDEAVSALMDLLRRREDGSSDRWRRQGALVVVDGPTGAGKTTLAHSLVGALARGNASYGARVLELEAVVPGWDGLAEGTKTWRKISRNLRKGKPASYREWDWHADAPGPKHTINPAQETVIICEGVGAITGTCDVRIVVKAPNELRYRRAIDRDGETYRPHWERWAAQEEALFAAYSATYAQADIIYRTA